MNTRGVTLIELLVMVAILGLLVAGTLSVMTNMRVRAADTAALTCARTIKSAEESVRTKTGQYRPYLELTTGSPCVGVLPPVGQALEASFFYAVRHARGSLTYLVSQDDLRYTSLSPTTDMVMGDGSPLGQPETPRAPSAPVEPPVPAGVTRLKFTLENVSANAFYGEYTSVCMNVLVPGGTPELVWVTRNADGSGVREATIDVPSGAAYAVSATTEWRRDGCGGRNADQLYGARFADGQGVPSGLYTQQRTVTAAGGTVALGLNYAPARTAIRFEWRGADGQPISDAQLAAYNAVSFYQQKLHLIREDGAIVPAMKETLCSFPFQAQEPLYAGYPDTMTFRTSSPVTVFAGQPTITGGFLAGGTVQTFTNPAVPEGCVTIPISTNM